MKIDVSAIIVNEDKVLLIQRALDDSNFPGVWGIPGGGMEDTDASLEAVAVRETFEEVGLDVVPEEIIHNNRFKDVVFVVMLAGLDSDISFDQKLNISSEINDYAWVDASDIEGKEFTPFTQDLVLQVLELI